MSINYSVLAFKWDQKEVCGMHTTVIFILLSKIAYTVISKLKKKFAKKSFCTAPIRC